MRIPKSEINNLKSKIRTLSLAALLFPQCTDVLSHASPSLDPLARSTLRARRAPSRRYAKLAELLESRETLRALLPLAASGNSRRRRVRRRRSDHNHHCATSRRTAAMCRALFADPVPDFLCPR